MRVRTSHLMPRLLSTPDIPIPSGSNLCCATNYDRSSPSVTGFSCLLSSYFRESRDTIARQSRSQAQTARAARHGRREGLTRNREQALG
jgi:hypothetical protein